MKRLVLVLIALAIAPTLLLAGCGGGPARSQQPVYRTSAGSGQRAHSPTFGLPPNGIRPALTPRASVASYLMLDTTDDPASTFSGLTFTVVAGYTSGHWPTFWQMNGHYRHVVSIAVNVSHTAECLDVEPGDAVPAQVVSWYHLDVGAGYSKPCFYASLYNGMASIRANLTAAGIPRSGYYLWDADWTYSPRLDSGYDATQWTDRYAGRNIDGSQVTAEFGGIQTGPTPVDFRNWRRARDASLTGYRHHCQRPVLTSGACGQLAWRVNHFQVLVDQQGQGPKCFGVQAKPTAPVCQITRPAVAVWSRASAASQKWHNLTVKAYFDKRIATTLGTSRL